MPTSRTPPDEGGADAPEHGPPTEVFDQDDPFAFGKASEPAPPPRKRAPRKPRALKTAAVPPLAVPAPADGDRDGGAATPTEAVTSPAVPEISHVPTAATVEMPGAPLPPPAVEVPAPVPEAEPEPESHSVLMSVGPSGVEGIPATYDDGTAWLRNGFRRQVDAVWVALLASWTGIWVCFWGAAIGLVLGALIAAGLASQFTGLGVGQAATAIGVVGGGLAGALDGFWAVFKFLVVDRPLQAILSVVSGAILALCIVIVIATFERVALRGRGYRRLSRDEVRRVAPLVKDAADAMDLPALPRFAMSDVMIPNAWTHMRTIVLTKGVLQTLNDDELRAVLAHELEHWRKGDAVGLHIVWAVAWPVALVYNIGMALAGRGGKANPRSTAGATRTLLALIGWIFAWPAWAILKVLIAPTVAEMQRKYEYEADAAAKDIGLAADMITVLQKMSAFEAGRTGWEQAIAATHPPTELRIEALQEPKPDDAEYTEDELRWPKWSEFRRIASGWRKKRTKKTSGEHEQQPAA